MIFFGTNDLTNAIAQVAPIYNLAFVIITIILFVKLLRTANILKTDMTPWKIIFVSVMVYVVEEVLTVLRSFEVIDISVHINGFFELVIIALFIYAILVQKQITKHD